MNKETVTEKIEKFVADRLLQNLPVPAILILGRSEYDNVFYDQYGMVRYEDKIEDTSLVVSNVEIILDKNKLNRFTFFYS